jgi:hypothetical protein
MNRIKLFEQFINYISIQEKKGETSLVDTFSERGMLVKSGDKPDSLLARKREDVPSNLKEISKDEVTGIVSKSKFKTGEIENKYGKKFDQYKDLVDLIDDIQDVKNVKWNTEQILALLDSIKDRYVYLAEYGGCFPAIRVAQMVYFKDEDPRTMWSEVMSSNAPWDGCKKEIGEKIKECYRAWLEPKADLPGLSGQASKIFSSIKDGTGIPESMKSRKSPAWNIDFLKRGTIKGHMKNPDVRLDAYKVWGRYPENITPQELSEKIKGTQKYLGVPETGTMDEATWVKWVKSICAIAVNDVFKKYNDPELTFTGGQAKKPDDEKLKKAVEKIQGYAKEYFYDKMLVDGKIGSQTLTAILFIYMSYLKLEGKIK